MTQGIEIAYSYEGVPTIEHFSCSNAFMRGLMGPFGCLPADSEFLTPNGWKRMCDYLPGDLVAQWSQSGQIEFVEPSDFIVQPCREFIEFDSGSLVMQLSPEHRVPHFNWAGRFQVKTAEEIERRPSKRTIPTTFSGPNGDGLGMSDDMIRFAVMMHADGHYPKQGRQAVVCVRKERKKERLRALLQRLGVDYAERAYPKRPTETSFYFVPPYRGKRYEGMWWSASQHDLAIVLDEMRHWDGHEDEMLIYSSAHKEDADFIQYAAHANGLRASIATVRYDNPKWLDNYRVQIRMGDNAKNRAQVRCDTTKISRIPSPDGLKYCFTVPSGFFVARCEDTIFVTGNSGKSSGCVIELVNRALAQKPGPDGIRRSRWGVIRNTFGELSGTTIKTIFQWLPPAHFGRYIEAKHTYTVRAFPGCEFEFVFIALDRPDDIKRLLSLELTGAWVNEAREVPWSIIEVLQGRVGRYPAMKDGGASWSGVIMDTNPPDTDSSWYKYFEEKNWLKDFNRMKAAGELPLSMRPQDFACIFKQPSGLSPEAENLPNLPGGRLYYSRLATGKAPEWVKVYVHGSYGFVIEGKLVYPEYSDSLHCKPVDPMPGVAVIRSWDFGLTPACAFSQLLPTGQWLTFDEMTSDNMSVDQFGDEVQEKCTRSFRGQVSFEDYGDPAGQNRAETDARSAFDILQAKDIQIEAAFTQEPTLRQEAVRKVLRTLVGGEPQFILNPRCVVLRKGFMGGYHRRRMQTKGPERYSEKAEKNSFSHPHDALQYGVVEYFGRSLVTHPQNEDDEWEGTNYGQAATTDSETGY